MTNKCRLPKRKSVGKYFVYTSLLIMLLTGIGTALSIGDSSSAWDQFESEAATTHNDPMILNKYSEIWNISGEHYVLAADIDGNNLKEVICTNGAALRAFDNQGVELWNTSTNSRINLIANVTGDVNPEIITSHRNGNILHLFVYDNSGTLLKTLSRSGGSDSSIVALLAQDLDNDGNVEILANLDAAYSGNPRGVSLFDYDSGSELWYYDVGPAGKSVDIGDIDNDGVLDVVRGGGSWHNGASGSGVTGTATTTTDSDIYTIAFRADTGQEIFTKNYFSDGESEGFVDHAIVDLNNDGNYNILAFEGHSQYYPGTVQIHLINGSGSVLKTWNGPYVSGTVSHGADWAVADFNNDGFKEIAVKFDSLDSLVMLDHNLNQITSLSLNIESYDMLANDAEGDGNIEILLADETNNKLRVFNDSLGELWNYDVEGPYHSFATSDLNADGINEIIISGDDTHVLSFMPPVANFTADVTSGIAPLDVQFIDNSTGNPTSWEWNFGDGQSSTEQNPSHTYQKSGVYTISLTVENEYGNSTITKNFIHVTSDHGHVRFNLPTSSPLLLMGILGISVVLFLRKRD